MNTDEIIEMARKINFNGRDECLVAFAKLVAAAEREACAKEAEDSDHVVLGRSYHDQLGNAGATAKNIAVAIRARGQS